MQKKIISFYDRPIELIAYYSRNRLTPRFIEKTKPKYTAKQHKVVGWPLTKQILR